jgi:2-hydroxychromene-2-carboxylate isomerase
VSRPAPLEAARLTVLLDLRHPEAYLALPSALGLAEEGIVDVDWLPLRVPALRPPSEPAPDDDRGIRHRRHRARAIAREIEVYGRAQGLVLRDLYRDPDTRAFELAWLFVRERDPARLPPFLLEGFRAYWALELDPSDAEAVRAIASRVGVDLDDLDRWWEADGAALADRVAESLRERGLFGVPGYWIDDEYFLGRQHLPMIRWIVGGRQGTGPI